MFTTSVFARKKILIDAAKNISNGSSFRRSGGFTPAATQFFSSTTDEKRESLVQTELNPEVGVATMTLARPPVNALSLEMCEAISSSIKECEANDKIQAVILKSACPMTFCSGLDLLEMAPNPDPDRLDKFWASLQQGFLDLYGSRLATIAAIEGHAPAGGCMVAMACDYRLMGSNPKISIGLNEAKFGIVAPFWMADLMVRTVGHREAEKSLALGTLYCPQDAARIGLVDEVVVGDVLARAHEIAAKYVSVPAASRFSSKILVRSNYIKELEDRRSSDLQTFTRFVLSPPVQQHLSSYLSSLRTKQK